MFKDRECILSFFMSWLKDETLRKASGRRGESWLFHQLTWLSALGPQWQEMPDLWYWRAQPFPRLCRGAHDSLLTGREQADTLLSRQPGVTVVCYWWQTSVTQLQPMVIYQVSSPCWDLPPRAVWLTMNGSLISLGSTFLICRHLPD